LIFNGFLLFDATRARGGASLERHAGAAAVADESHT
jgi:hypothetical protein